MALAASLVLAACVDSIDPLERIDGASHTSAEESSGGAPSLTLLSPEDGARIAQNDSSLGCPAHEFRGSGFAIHFDWTDAESVQGLDGYQLFVQHRGSPYPLIDRFSLESEYAAVYCNAFVIDRNASSWYWFVRAVDSVGMIAAASDTGWFSFESCVLSNGEPCSAPPESGPVQGSGVARERDATGVNHARASSYRRAAEMVP